MFPSHNASISVDSLPVLESGVNNRLLQRVDFLAPIPSHLDAVLILPRLREVVRELHLEPRLRCAAECFRQPNRHFGADAGLAVNDVVECLPGHTKQLRSVGHG